ncbi:MAG: hypothetical protein MUC36_26465 [Planctomycetes bacterium]|jgi:hypothetical protein|nr:hypothetical protein [Planctomycetota bacterium]
MSSTIAIHYRLLRAEKAPTSGAPPLLQEVDSAADLELQRQIQDADTNKRVTSVGTVAAQNSLLHEHVKSVPFELPILGYQIELDQAGISMWDRDLKYWIRIAHGGAIYFAVGKNGDLGRLFLAVWTEGAKPATDLADEATA